MTTHKRIQRDYTSTKSIEIQFNIDFDGTKSTITNIQINGNFNSELPHSPTLEMHEGKMALVAYIRTEENGKTVSKRVPILNNKYADDIVSEILRIRDDETPKFIN